MAEYADGDVFVYDDLDHGLVTGWLRGERFYVTPKRARLLAVLLINASNQRPIPQDWDAYTKGGGQQWPVVRVAGMEGDWGVSKVEFEPLVPGGRIVIHGPSDIVRRAVQRAAARIEDILKGNA